MYLLRLVISYFVGVFLAIGSPSTYLFAEISSTTLPTGGNVVSGNITISTPEVGKMNVDQTSNQGIINWNTFNVGSSASVHFNQPSVKSSILNNVLSGTSIIHGSIFSNGRLILVNPTGILTGPTSAIRAEGAILSTLKITNNNFLNNNFSFSTNSASSITTKGNINGEYVALISPEISNKGKITTNVATALAAGDDVRLSISDSNLLTVAVNPSKLKTSIKNEGNIKTQNGIVTLKTDVAQSVVDEIVKTDDAKAKGLVTENGVVKLVTNTGTIEAKDIKIDAGSKGSSEISGKLNSNSNTSNGGTIEVTAKDIDVNAATISADGKTGGGKVLIGGDWQGSGDLLQATYLNIDDATKISADALISGSGGTIVAWSNIKDENSLTKVSGTLSAKGIDGDGGQIETSGNTLLYNNIKVNTSSESGAYGNWLLDPTNLTIGSSEASTHASSLETTNVTLTADETITVNNNISYTGARDSTLTFDATTTVLNANISSNNGTLSIDINTILEIGASNTSITTNGGNVDVSGIIRAVSGENNNFTIDAGAGNVTFSSNVTPAVGDYSAGFTQGNFTSVSDLDFSGTFLNAINLAGTATTIGDVTFQDGRASNNSISNANLSFQHEIQNWNARNYGNTGLNNIMKGIRWSGGSGHSPYVQFTNASAGQKYKIQALFKEQNYNRYFDVYVDGTKIVDNFRPKDAGGTSVNRGRYLTYQFEAASTNVMFRMSGRTAENSGSKLHNNDINPILNAISIETLAEGTAINNLSITANQFSAQDIKVGGTLSITNSGTSEISGAITGDTALTKAGSGQLTVSGTNTYTGNTTINGGTLIVSGKLGSGTYSGNISNSGAFRYSASGAQNLDGVISGSGTVTTTQGILRLRGTNTYTGNSTSSGSGRLVVEGKLGGGSYAGNISNTSSNSYGVIFNTSAAQTVSGVLSGSGIYSLSDADTSGVLTLTGSNTFSSIWNHSGGTLIVGNNNALGSNPRINISNTSNTKRLGISNSATLPSLTLSGAKMITLTTDLETGSLTSTNSNINIGSNDLTTGSDNTSTTFAGVISGSGNIVKQGSGTLTLTGVNTYSGNTTISAGSLKIDGSGNLRSGSYSGSIVNNGTFEFASSGNLIASGVISGSGSVKVSGSGVFEPTRVNTYTGGTIIDGGKIAAAADRNFGAVPGSSDADNILLRNSGTIYFGSVNSSNSSGHVTYGNNNRHIYLEAGQHNFIDADGGSGRNKIYTVISGPGGVTYGKTGNKTMTIYSANTYTGDTRFNYTSGSNNGVHIANANAWKFSTVYLSNTKTDVRKGWTVVSGSSINFGGLAGDATDWRWQNKQVTFGYNNQNTTFSGSVSQYNNSGYDLVKVGTGTTTFSNTSSNANKDDNNGIDIQEGKIKLAGNWGKSNDSDGNFAIASGATLEIDSSVSNTFDGTLSGSGTLILGGSGTQTFSANNTFSGTINIADGGIKANHASAFGTVTSLISSGGRISTASNITLSSLTVTGNVQLDSGIKTTGAQIYNNNVIVNAGTRNSPVEFTTTNSNIDFKGTLKGQGNAKNRSMTINAGTGNVLFGDRVGYAFNDVTVDPDNTSDSFYKMVVTGDQITIKGDVMTYEEQTYNGNVLIGSTGSNGLTRTLLSMDPKVVFNGTVNDTLKGIHTLIAKAVEIDRGVNSTPTVDFKSTVGKTVALKNYRGLTGYQTTGANWGVIDNSSPFGTATGTGQKMGPQSTNSNDNAKKAQRGVQQFKKSFRSENGRNIFEMTSFRFGGKGNSLSFRKNVDIIYGDSPEFGAPVKTSRGNPNRGGFGGGEGLFGRLFGKPSPDIRTGPNSSNNPNFNPGEFREGANNEFNNSGPDRNIKELYKTFEGGKGKGKFFNPYALENRQIERQKSPNNSQQDIRLEDDDA